MNVHQYLCHCVLALLLLGGCAQISVPVPAPAAAQLPAFSTSFGARPELLSEAQVHLLTPAQQQAFLGYFNSPSRANVPAHRRLFNYLEIITTDFAYESATYTASEVLDRNGGNCLSLAILTTALARLADVEIHYQLIDSRPLFELNGSVANKEVHVRSILYEPRSTASTGQYALRSFYLVDYLPELRGRVISNIDDSEYQAMYYLNMAAEATAAARYNEAFWLAREALALHPVSAQALNVMAIIHRRNGDHATAEAIYLYGIEQARDKLSLLKNYHLLLTMQGRAEEAAAVLTRLQAMDDPSPFNWLNLARESYADGNYPEALHYFDQALARAPNLHEAHLGKAQSYYQMGRRSDTRAALRLALDNVTTATTRSLYEAKLSALAGN